MESFVQHDIVPSIVDTAPPKRLTIKYDSGVEVSEGDALTPTQVQNQPTVEWEAETNKLYTLVMIDPDVPNRADRSQGEFEQWLVINIPGNDVSKGETLAGYISSGPSKGSGLHRYVFLVYEQSGRVDVGAYPRKSSTEVNGRTRWKVAEFATKYGLGKPLFGNFYQAEYDDYVPILYKKFGFEARN